MSCPVCPKVLQYPNDGSGLGYGSNEVAIVTGQPSTWSYSNYIANVDRINALEQQRRGIPKFKGVRSAPVFYKCHE